MSEALIRWQNWTAKIPRFKSPLRKKLDSSFSIDFANQAVKVDLNLGEVRLPKGMPALKFNADKKFKANLCRLGIIDQWDHSQFKGGLQHVTLKRDGSKMFIIFNYVIPAQTPVAPDNCSAVGIDLGVAKSCSISNRVFVSLNDKMKELDVRIDRCKSEMSANNISPQKFRALQNELHFLYARKKNIIKENYIKTAKDLCEHNALIVFEDLHISNMTRSAKGTIENPGKHVAQKSGLNRSINNNCWYELRKWVLYYATKYKCVVLFVPAAGTSQKCPECGHVAAVNRPKQATFKCVNCEHEDNADLNAAINIRDKGLALLPKEYQKIFRSSESVSQLPEILKLAHYFKVV